MANVAVESEAPSVFLATLGAAPQVVTITYNLLKQKYQNIPEVVILRTHSHASKVAADLLDKEFSQKEAYGALQFRDIVLDDGHEPVFEMDSESSLITLMKTLFGLVAEVHSQNKHVQIGIAGGRKVMGIAAMVVAQLTFKSTDNLWHLFSDFYSLDDQVLHARPEQNSRIVRVPVIPYRLTREMLSSLRQLTNVDALFGIIEDHLRSERNNSKSFFVKHALSAAERKVVELVCKGFDNDRIARERGVSPNTIKNQLHNIYEKLDEWREWQGDLPAEPRNYIIAKFSPYFYVKDLIG